MSRIGQVLVIALVGVLTQPAVAQTPARHGATAAAPAPKPSAAEAVNIDAGKSGEQLFKANCAICHKSAAGLAKAGGLLGVQSFLREHYTASKESAAIIGAYLQAVDAAKPPSRAVRQRANPDAKRTSKKSDESKPVEAKPGAKPADAKPADAKPAEVKPADAKTEEAPRSAASVPAESKPAESKPAQAAPAEPKPAAPAEQKPADAPKSE